jgi:hypothetical protein
LAVESADGKAPAAATQIGAIVAGDTLTVDRSYNVHEPFARRPEFASSGRMGREA